MIGQDLQKERELAKAVENAEERTFTSFAIFYSSKDLRLAKVCSTIRCRRGVEEQWRSIIQNKADLSEERDLLWQILRCYTKHLRWRSIFLQKATAFVLIVHREAAAAIEERAL
jgi:hypothetical protein